MNNYNISNCFLLKPQNIDIKNACKLFFVCHQNDFDDYFEDVTNEILEKTTDNNISAVFFHINPDAVFDFENTKDFIENMQLIVVPVTWELLSTSNMVIEQIIPYALEKHIPFLPLLQDSDLVNEYTKHFGNMQFLCDNPNDKTAIPYDVKLNDFIKDTLVGDELRRRVQAAFDAYIFLSYRKKDRKIAQEIMHLIHKNEFCRDIAIWYDEFLKPGEDFNNSIQKAIEKSDLFAMVVTPNIVEPDNYIILHEYPMADYAKKTILPLESIETNKNKLNEYYKNIPSCTDVHNSGALSSALLRNLNIAARQENTDSPEHNYLIGLAYLTGIDVEVNHKRGIELIKKAAEKDLPEAISRMITIYRTGIGCNVNYNECLYWSDRLVNLYKKLYSEYDSEGWLKLAQSLYNKQSILFAADDGASAKLVAEETAFYAEAVLEKSDLSAMFVIFVFTCILLSESEKQIIIREHSTEGVPSPEVISNAFKASIPPLLKAEEFMGNYAKKHPEQDFYVYKMLIYTYLCLGYSNYGDIKKTEEYFKKRIHIAKINGMHEIVEDINFQWMMFKKLNEIDFNNPEDLKCYFISFMENLNEKTKTLTPKNAIFLLEAATKISSVLELIPLQNVFDDPFYEKCFEFIETGIACYEAIPKKYINNLVFGDLKRLLDLGETIAKEKDDTKKWFLFYKKKVEINEEILNRFKSLDNQRNLQNSVFLLCNYALKNQKLDDAYKYGIKNYNICLEIVRAENAEKDDHINFIEALSFLRYYYMLTKNKEKSLECAKAAKDVSVNLCKRYMTGESLRCFGQKNSDLAELLFIDNRADEALEYIQISDSAYSGVMAKFSKDIDPVSIKDYYVEYCQTIKLHGDILYKKKNFKEAINQYHRCLYLSQKLNLTDLSNKSLYKLAQSYMNSCDKKNAKKTFEEYLCHMPPMPDNPFDLYYVSITHFNLATLTKKINITQLNLAKAGFEKLLLIDPHDELYNYYYETVNELLTKHKNNK